VLSMTFPFSFPSQQGLNCVLQFHQTLCWSF